jgi:hypothetical protein
MPATETTTTTPTAATPTTPTSPAVTTPTTATTSSTPTTPNPEHLIIPMRPATVALTNMLTSIGGIGVMSGTAGIMALAAMGITGAAIAQRSRSKRASRTTTRRSTGTSARDALGGFGRGARRAASGLGRSGRPTVGGLGRGARKAAGGIGRGGRPTAGGLGRGARKAAGGIGRGGRPTAGGRHTPSAAMGRLRRALDKPFGGQSNGGTKTTGSKPGNRSNPTTRSGTRNGGGICAGINSGKGTTRSRRWKPTIRITIRPAYSGLRMAGKCITGILGFAGWLMETVMKAITALARYLKKLCQQTQTMQALGTSNRRAIRTGSKIRSITTSTRPAPLTGTGKPTMGKSTKGGHGPGSMAFTGRSDLFALTQKYYADVLAIQPRGNMEVRDEAYDLAAVITMFAAAVQARGEHNTRRSINPDYNQVYARTSGALLDLAATIKSLGPLFDAFHPERVADLLVGQDPAGWDTTNNPGVHR